MKTNITLPAAILILVTLLSGCGNDETVAYREYDHGDWIEEFGPHEKVDGWWFMNGNLTEVENPSQRYTIYWAQFNLRTVVNGLSLYMLHMGLVDLNTGEIYFEQKQSPIVFGVYANGDEVSFAPHSLFTRNEDSFELNASISSQDVAYNLTHNFGKGPTWHGDDGVFVMGVPEDPKARTVYYSFTRMPTSGSLTLPDGNGGIKTVAVTGETWLERQWGPYMDYSRFTYWAWEWASIRFFDNEEIMIFSFPQHNYADGTYIRADGSSQRISNITHEPYDYFLADIGSTYYNMLLMGIPVKSRFLCYGEKWELTIPGIKEEHYRLEPYLPGYLHAGFSEMGADIINDSGEVVGYAFIEGIPFLREGMCTE